MRRALLLALSLVLAGATVALRTDACSCSWYPTADSPLPPNKVPTNVHIVVTKPGGWPASPISNELGAPKGRFRVELRTPSTSKRAPRIVPARVVTVVTSDDTSTLEVIPEAPLTPQSLYEVWAIDDSPSHASRLLRVVRADAVEDRAPPVWSGPTDVHFLPANPMDLCGSGSGLDFTGARAIDDGPVRYELWLVPDAPIDVLAQPSLVATAWTDPADGLFSVGMSGCSWPATIPVSPALHVGVRAIDWAGNASPMYERVVVSTTMPAKTKASGKP